MKIDPNKNFAGNTVTGVRRLQKNGKWKLTKIACTQTRIKPMIYKGESYPNPFEIRALSLYDYERVPNINNPRFFELLEAEWLRVVPDYLQTIQRQNPETSKKRLKEIEENCRRTTVTTYVMAVEVLKLMREIKWIGPDFVERRMYNPDEIRARISRCELAILGNDNPFSVIHRVPYQTEWFRTDGSENNGRPYPDTTTWQDVEQARANGF